ncbi:hypothetical protein RQP46_010772 [Phenoliferia psychrophenolica]
MFQVTRVKAKEPGFFPRPRPSPYPSRTERLVLPRPPRPNPPLPNEILELIVNELYADLLEEEGETEASEMMATLCLVAKCFLGPARAALYHRKEISIQGSTMVEFEEDEFWMFDIPDFFSDSPHITRLIQDVEIRIDATVRDVRVAHDHIFRLLEVSPRICRIGLLLEESQEEDARRTLVGLAERCPPLLSLKVEAPDPSTVAYQDDLARLMLSQPSIRHLDLSLASDEEDEIGARGPQPTFELHTLNLRLDDNTLNPSLFTLLTNTSTDTLTSLSLSVYNTEIDFSVFTSLKTLSFSGLLCSANLTQILEGLKILPRTTLNISGMMFREAGVKVEPNVFNFLAPTLTDIRLPTVHLADLLEFLKSDACPKLEKLNGQLFEGHSWFAGADINRALSTSIRVGTYRVEIWDDPTNYSTAHLPSPTPPPALPLLGPSRRARPLVQAVLERFW